MNEPAAMQVLLNGRIVPDAEAVVSVFDRSFQLGDGLFETIRVCNARPFRWDQHMQRLKKGADFLGIKLPFSTTGLSESLALLLAANGLRDAILRLHVSRGVGRRGYSPTGATEPTWVVSLHPLPAPDRNEPLRWRVITSSLCLSPGPLSRFKTANRLTQILARAEADAANVDEAILLNSSGEVVEAAAANLFWIKGDKVIRVPDDQGALPGVTQALVIELCQSAGIPVLNQLAKPEQIQRADGCFLTLAPMGIIEVLEWDGKPLPQSPLVRRLFDAYRTALQHECGRRSEFSPNISHS